MTVTRVLGLPTWLRLLASYPEPHQVMSSLATGPLDAYGACVARLWLVDGMDLVHVAAYGQTREEIERYSILPDGVAFAIHESVRTGEPIITDASNRSAGPVAEVDAHFWQGVLDRSAAASVVRAPISHRGTCIGAIGLITQQPWPRDPEARLLLDGVCAALGMWAANPASGAVAAVRASRGLEVTGAFILNPRQRQILLLVRDGLPTSVIASELHLSVSAVKADLQSATRALGTSNRDKAVERALSLGLL